MTDHDLASDSPPTPRGFAGWLDVRFRSPAAIYGTIVFAAFLAIGSDHAEDPMDLLDNAILSLIVFFLAHVFAHTLTDHGEHGFRSALRQAVTHSAGMLYAAIPPTLVIVIGSFTDASVEDLYDITVWVTIAVLAVLGYVAYWRRGTHLAIRLLGAFGTGLLGFLLVVLEYAVH
jgi:hypothetical protein